MFTDAALDRFEFLPAALRLARNVIFSIGDIGDRRRHDERHQQRDKRGERFRGGPEQAVECADGDDGRDCHRTNAYRIDIVEMCALELHILRTQAERLVDDEISNERTDPGDRHIGIERQGLLERLVDADLHQQQRDENVEHQPDHSAGVAVGQA